MRKCASLEPAKTSNRSKRSERQQCHIWNMFPNRIYLFTCIWYRPLSSSPLACHQQRGGRHHGRFSRPIFAHQILHLWHYSHLYRGYPTMHIIHHSVPVVESYWIHSGWLMIPKEFLRSGQESGSSNSTSAEGIEFVVAKCELRHFVFGATNKSDQHADFSWDSEATGVLTSSIRRVACLVAGAAAGCYCKMPLQGACVRVRFVLWSCQGSAVRVLLSECCVSECRTR